MATRAPVRGRAAGLTGRRSECAVLDGLIEAVRAGESRALVVRSEPVVGKTALLDYVVERASVCVVARAAGVHSEMELAFAGVASVVRVDARSPRTDPSSAAHCAAGRVGHQSRFRTGSLPGGPGGPEPALRRCRSAAADLPSG